MTRNSYFCREHHVTLRFAHAPVKGDQGSIVNVLPQATLFETFSSCPKDLIFGCSEKFYYSPKKRQRICFFFYLERPALCATIVDG